MITAIGIVFSIICVLLVDLTGRRPILLIGIALAAIFNAVVRGVGSKRPITDSDINTIVASLVMVSVGNKLGVNPLSCQ
jgi:SP family sugar:H+ symporter-like MFS transporter